MKLEEESNQLRPSLMQIQCELNRVKKVSFFLALFLSFFFVILWPVISVSFDDFSLVAFRIWILIGQIFIVASFVYFLVAPYLERYIVKIISAAKRSKQLLVEKTFNSSKNIIPTDYFTYRLERQKITGSVSMSSSET